VTCIILVILWVLYTVALGKFFFMYVTYHPHRFLMSIPRVSVQFKVGDVSATFKQEESK